MFQTVNYYQFDGRPRSLKEISKLTGIHRDTLQMRVMRGIPLSRPIAPKRPKTFRKRPVLTGNRDRDLETIVAYMHQRFYRTRPAAPNACLHSR